jgi:hypothetical protein
MSRPDSWHPSEDGLRTAQTALDRVIYDLGDLVASRGIRTEEMIRVAGFFESAKALWLASGSPANPMPMAVFANRLRVLADICPPELRQLGQRLEQALKVLDESVQRQKRA